ncbi:MAG: hypothetical protein FJ288_09825 [Planctomycetes bacterium]|nr:hypothetical protein [Planctomycetota bacterium]
MRRERLIAFFSIAAGLALAAVTAAGAPFAARVAASAAIAAAPVAAPAATSAVRSAADQPSWIGEGTPYATPYYVIDSGKAGPTVLVVGGVHGNEPAGAGAAEAIRRWTVARGKLVVLPQANRPALAARTRETPRSGAGAAAAGSEANLNRAFPSAPSEPQKGPLAAAIWRMVEGLRPDWLIDLHEGGGIAGAGDESVGSSVISCRDAQARDRAQSMLDAVNATLDDERNRFVLRSQPIAGSLARAAGDRLGVRTMILETTSADQPRSLRQRQHRVMVHRLLEDLKMAAGGPDVIAGPPGRLVRVAIYDGYGAHPSPTLDAILAADGDMSVQWVGKSEVVGKALGQFDVLVVPGGSGSAEAKGLDSRGSEAVRDFVRAGGGYVGICAGAYLATTGYTWSLGIINARMIDYNRGRAELDIELTDAGRSILGNLPGRLKVIYANGPVVGPSAKEGLPPYTVLATFLGSPVPPPREPKAEMKGTPAIVCAPHEKGRVITISPHPEKTAGLEGLARNAVRWAAGRQPRPLDERTPVTVGGR